MHLYISLIATYIVIGFLYSFFNGLACKIGAKGKVNLLSALFYPARSTAKDIEGAFRCTDTPSNICFCPTCKPGTFHFISFLLWPWLLIFNALQYIFYPPALFYLISLIFSSLGSIKLTKTRIEKTDEQKTIKELIAERQSIVNTCKEKEKRIDELSAVINKRLEEDTKLVQENLPDSNWALTEAEEFDKKLLQQGITNV